MVRATLIYIFVGIFVALAGPPGILWAMLSGSTDHLFSLSRFCIRVAGWICGIRVKIHGRERMRDGQAYLFLSNHRANFDGPIMVHATRRNCRAVIKKEIMRLPVLARVLRQANYVPIDRADPIQARAAVERAASLMKAGYSFFAFPEGTRSRDGRLGIFKKGVFVMAIKAGVPVVPVSILNSGAIQTPGRYGIKPASVDVIFHEPIATDQMQLEDREKLLQATRAAIESSLVSSPEQAR